MYLDVTLILVMSGPHFIEFDVAALFPRYDEIDIFPASLETD
jgi:hypothetical protein